MVNSLREARRLLEAVRRRQRLLEENDTAFREAMQRAREAGRQFEDSARITSVELDRRVTF